MVNTQNLPSGSRRSFLKSASVATGAIAFGVPTLLRGQNLNEKLNLAVIGTGGRGGANLRSVESENIVALCDVNEKNLNLGPGSKTALFR